MKVNKRLAAAGLMVPVVMLTAPESALSAQTGAELYSQHCSSCHQSDGSGVPMMQPALVGSSRANGPIGGVIEMILKGSAVIPVGTSDYMAEMPSFEKLTDTEIALITTYVRTSFDNKGGPVAAGDVARQR